MCFLKRVLPFILTLMLGLAMGSWIGHYSPPVSHNRAHLCGQVHSQAFEGGLFRAGNDEGQSANLADDTVGSQTR